MKLFLNKLINKFIKKMTPYDVAYYIFIVPKDGNKLVIPFEVNNKIIGTAKLIRKEAHFFLVKAFRQIQCRFFAGSAPAKVKTVFTSKILLCCNL